MDRDVVIEINNLTKYYGKSRGIVDVTLNVNRGEIFGFLGPNGAGKTTTIRTLMDLIRPTKGSARVLGMDPQKEGAKVRNAVGYLPSDFGMSSRETSRQYLFNLHAMMGKKGYGRIEEIAEIFDLDLDRRIKDLSRGNKQKVGIVSAFMHSPPLLILDEPTTGLDPLMQQEFYRLLREEKARGVTVFLSSHILPEVDAVCDRVGIIREGRLIVVEPKNSFKKKMGKRMTVSFKDGLDPGMFSRIDGVEVEFASDREIILIVSRNVESVIKELSRYSVVDLSFDEIPLEELFLKYYVVEKGGGST
ncbi:MAG: ABC transporter ATP-binding protein [Thermoplasmatota archaeon]